MPDLDGFELLRRIRQLSRVPVIMLSGRGEVEDRTRCLDLGADYYLTKPFDSEELAATTRAVLRRASTSQSRGLLLFDNGLLIDLESRTVRLKGREIELENKEFDFLAELAGSAGKTLSKQHLLTVVWGPEYAADDSILYPHISRLRKKLKPDPDHPRYILTVSRIGYRFQPAITSHSANRSS